MEAIAKVGKGEKADICVINLKKLHCVPYDPEESSIMISHLVFSATGADVETVFIDGKMVMEDRILKNIDEQELLANANHAARDLLRRLHLKGVEIK